MVKTAIWFGSLERHVEVAGEALTYVGHPPPQAGLARELSHSSGDTSAIYGFSGQSSRLHAPEASLYDQTPNSSRWGP